MMISKILTAGALVLALALSGCGEGHTVPSGQEEQGGAAMETEFTVDTPIQTVMDDSAFGGGDLPQPGAVIMQYTGLGEYSPSDPPTYACVGDQEGIASWRVMKTRLDALSALGIDTEFHVYVGLGHCFGLGTGTSAEGWLDLAVRFWRWQM